MQTIENKKLETLYAKHYEIIEMQKTARKSIELAKKNLKESFENYSRLLDLKCVVKDEITHEKHKFKPSLKIVK